MTQEKLPDHSQLLEELHSLRRENSVLKESLNIFQKGPAVYFKWVNGKSWPIEIVSPNVSQIFGYMDNELIDGTISYADLIHPEDLERVTVEVKAASQASHSSFDHQPYRIIHKDGSIRWLNDHSQVIRDQNNNITHFSGYVLDITREMEALDSLGKQESLLKEAQQVACVGNWEWGVMTGEVYWSDEIYRLFGYKPGEIEPSFEAFIQPIHPDDQSHVTDAINKALMPENDEHYHTEHRVVLPGGEIRYLQERGYVEFTKDGQAKRMFGTTQDITKQKMVEQDLVLSRNLYDEAQRLAQLGHWQFNAKDESITWSDEVYNIFELNKDSFSPNYERFLASIHPEDRDKVVQAYDNSVKNRVPYEVEHRIVTKNGQLKYVRESGQTHYDENGNSIKTVGTIQDISQLKQTEISLQKAYEEMQLTLDQRSTDLSELNQQIKDGVQQNNEIENELRKERNFIESLVNTAQVIVLVLDVKGSIVRFNPYMEELSQYQLSEVKGKDWFSTFIPKQHYNRVKKVFNQVKVHAPKSSIVNAILSKDGREHMIEWWNKPLVNADGEVIGILSIGQDISQHVKLLDKLDSERLLLRTLIDETPAAICFKNHDGQWLEANQSMIDLFGLKKDDYKGKSNQELFGIIPPNLQGVFGLCNQYDSEVWEKKSQLKFDLTIPSRDGSQRIFDFTKTPLFNKQGDEEALLVIGHDITEREEEKNRRMVELDKQRIALVKEVHHRIKNHLQGLKGLLNLKRDDERNNDILNEAIGQIDSIAVVYGLQSHADSLSIYFCQMLDAIITSVINLYSDIPIQSSHEADALNYEVEPNKAVALALIINELLTNAVKHFRKKTKNDQVVIKHQHKKDSIHLVIENPGRLPDEFNLEDERTLGMGLGLVRTMLPSKGARLSIREIKDKVVTDLELTSPLLLDDK